MHFGKSHLEDKREDLRSHYGKIEKTAGVTALRIAFCLLLVVLVCGAGLVIGAVRGVIDSAPGTEADRGSGKPCLDFD